MINTITGCSLKFPGAQIKMALEEYQPMIIALLNSGETYESVSNTLRKSGLERGSSAANLRKFCKDRGINPRSRTVGDQALDTMVSRAVQEVQYNNNNNYSIYNALVL